MTVVAVGSLVVLLVAGAVVSGKRATNEPPTTTPDEHAPPPEADDGPPPLPPPGSARNAAARPRGREALAPALLTTEWRRALTAQRPQRTPAASHDGQLVGSYNPVQATCFVGSQVMVTSPTMTPSREVVILPDGTIVTDPPQWVAFRAHVAKWNGAAWGHAALGDWKAARVTHAGNNLADTWWNLRTNQWEAGTTSFSVYVSGYYRVYAEYYWYGDYGYPSGYTGTVWTPYHSDNGYMGWGDPWCTF